MKKIITSLLLFMVVSNPSLYAQKYEPAWSSIDEREIPQWWQDAKFGIFIHWGPYSVPAYAPIKEVEGVYEKYAEHYENRLKSKNKLFLDFHHKNYGPNFTYQDFAPLFKAEHFKPEQWAELFKKAGAKYVVLTSKHHDGFCLWPSKYSPNWNSVDIGAHRDLAGDLSKAVKASGLRMGFYYSLLEWSHPLYKQESIDQWVDRHMIPQMQELVNAYQPEVIFADGEWDYPSETLKSTTFLSWLYNESPVAQSVVVNDRWGKETRSKHGGYYTTEYDLVHDQKGIGDQASHPWEESRGIGTSYGYNRFETTEDYFTSKQLIDLLIDKVSNGGNLLLNVGPTADGMIPVIMQERLLDMGQWLAVNGEAIYGTKAWSSRPANSKETHGYFTAKGKDLYLICTEWKSGTIRVPLPKKPLQVSLLGYQDTIPSNYEGEELRIEAPPFNPGKAPCNYAWVYKLEGALE
ncbi:alpha-L-fucosidase [Olivibacter sp. CPCC 100613]|uniref:alpha-L-fucosidase n=1 Tax=Olivibacter sp. CPCC 100613 TaxID=3079931 RepID=UPI002FF6842D